VQGLQMDVRLLKGLDFEIFFALPWRELESEKKP
jgi:hypothetical protein